MSPMSVPMVHDHYDPFRWNERHRLQRRQRNDGLSIDEEWLFLPRHEHLELVLQHQIEVNPTVDFPETHNLPQ